VAVDAAEPPEASPLAATRLRTAFGAFATGVTVVTTRDGAGRPVGMTVNSFSAVSLSPPLVLWCVQRDVPPGEVFATAEHYAVHVLEAGQRALSDRFADPAKMAVRFEGIAVEAGLAGLPLIAGCPTRLQCAVVQRLDAGDHLVLIGQVLAIEHRAAAPLIFHGGRYLTG